MRILALDWGEVRIGAAVSDPDGKIAFPFGHFIESKNAIAEIKKIILDLRVDKVLIGLPKGLAGQSTESTRKASEFIQDLKNKIAQPVETLDERFSSIAAGKTLSDQGVSEKDQRGIKDNIAAQIMLQQYLDSNKN